MASSVIKQPNISNQIVVERIALTKQISTSSTQVEFSATKSGYKSIMVAANHSNATHVIGGLETVTYGNGTFYANGFFKHDSQTENVYFFADVLWVKS